MLRCAQHDSAATLLLRSGKAIGFPRLSLVLADKSAPTGVWVILLISIIGPYTVSGIFR